MDDDGILGGALNQFGDAVKKAGKQAVKISEETLKDAGAQIAGQKQKDKPQENKKSGSGWQSDEERIKFLKDLYGSSQKSSSDQDSASSQAKNASSSPKKAEQTEFEKQISDKSPEEQKKLLQLRQELHREKYYDPTFNPVKKQEERPAEKVENEKKKEMQDLQQKEAKKPQPLAVVREQNKTEMFRGAAG